MGEGHEFPEDPALCADDDPVGVAADVPDPCAGSERCPVIETTSRPANHSLGQVVGIAAGEPLDQEVEVHAIN